MTQYLSSLLIILSAPVAASNSRYNKDKWPNIRHVRRHRAAPKTHLSGPYGFIQICLLCVSRFIFESVALASIPREGTTTCLTLAKDTQTSATRDIWIFTLLDTHVQSTSTGGEGRRRLPVWTLRWTTIPPSPEWLDRSASSLRGWSIFNWDSKATFTSFFWEMDI